MSSFTFSKYIFFGSDRNASTSDTYCWAVWRALNIATGDLSNVQNALATPVNAPTNLQSGVTNGPIANSYGTGGQIQGQIGSQNINQSVQNAENASYAQQMGLLQPQQQQAAEAQQAGLTAQGLNPNDAAYQNSQTLFGNQQATQQAQVAANAVAAGNAEQNTLFGQQSAQGQFANSAQAQANTQNQAAAGFANTAQQQANSQAQANAALNNSAAAQGFGEQLTAQQTPINEFTALQSNSQVQAPSSNPAQTSVAPTDVTGAYALSAQQQQAQYQAQMAQYQSGLSGLYSLGSAGISALALSDVRVKRDIVPLSAKLGDFPLYAFRYAWDQPDDRHVGVMAQDVMQSRPDAVAMHPSGYLMVDYGKL